ncbi:MAG: radical SAM/SPASM domain-containing protein [Planctomycetota bacterium]
MSNLDQIYAEAFKDFEVGDFPAGLGVEVTNHCNLRCPMCPREIANRGYGNLDWDLFKKIADEAAGRPKTIFLPQGFGESLIHPEFTRMLSYLGEVGVELTMIVSNGTYLNEKNCSEIIDSGIAFINISLDGTDKETYEKIRVKANYEEVVENVERFFRIRTEKGAKLPRVILRMIKMTETADDVENYKARWQPFLEEGDEIAFSTYQTWSSSVEDKRVDAEVDAATAVIKDIAKEERKPCRMLFKTMQVYYDGRSTPCCYDYDCEMDIGNANDQTISEIWTGDKAQHFRKLHEDGRADEISICATCREFIP